MSGTKRVESRDQAQTWDEMNSVSPFPGSFCFATKKNHRRARCKWGGAKRNGVSDPTAIKVPRPARFLLCNSGSCCEFAPPTPKHQTSIAARSIPSRPAPSPSPFIMSPSAHNGEAEVGSDGPRLKGKATPDTLKYDTLATALTHLPPPVRISKLTTTYFPQNRMHRSRHKRRPAPPRRDPQHQGDQERPPILLQL